MTKKKTDYLSLYTTDGPVSISHLNTIERFVSIQLPAVISPKRVRIEFSFSIHCVTRNHDPAKDSPLERYPSNCIYKDASGPRIFCPDRYIMSKSIEKCIDLLIENNYVITRTGRDNYFSLGVAPEISSYIKEDSSYYIFLKISKEKPNQGSPFLTIYIESAYLRGPVAGTKNKGPFGEILGKIWANK